MLQFRFPFPEIVANTCGDSGALGGILGGHVCVARMGGGRPSSVLSGMEEVFPGKTQSFHVKSSAPRLGVPGCFLGFEA